MIKKKIRNLTVTCQSYYGNIYPPIIIMKGVWLKEWGFDFGTSVTVHCEYGKLTITKKGAEEEG